MTVWVLFVWLSATHVHTLGVYKDQAECEEYASNYRRYSCLKVTVPK